MTSPLTITVTPIKVVSINKKRYELFLQNTGSQNIYVKKQSLNGAITEPSATNYDFELTALGTASGIIKIESAASYMAVSAVATTTLGVMETFAVTA